MHFLTFIVLTFFIAGNCFSASGSGNVSNVVSMGNYGFSVAAGGNFLGGSAIPDSAISSAVGAGTGYFMLSISSALATFANQAAGPFIKNGAVYQVTGGKTAVCTHEYVYSANASERVQLLSDTSTIPYNTAVGSLVAPKYQGGAAGAYMDGTIAAQTSLSVQILYVFAASTYPGAQLEGGSSNPMIVKLWCKEI